MQLCSPRLLGVARTLVWRLVIPVARLRAKRRLAHLRPGTVTVVTVNWNSSEHLEVLIDLVTRRSPAGTEILVVDNGSEDRPDPSLTSRPGVSVMRLPLNLGHELALDLGVLRCRTEFAVALDVDAFPLHDRWLAELLAPLDSGSMISGARLNRSYVHPCCWAMRTTRFVREEHSFRSDYQPRAAGRDASGDVGEIMSEREAPCLHFLEVTSQRGPGDVGTVFGDLVYHNFYATRFSATDEDILDQAVSAEDPRRAWVEALELYGD